MEHCLTDGQARHGWGGWENGDLCHARARHLAPLPWGVYTEVELLDHVVIPSFNSLRSYHSIAMVVASFYVPISSAQGSNILANTSASYIRPLP